MVNPSDVFLMLCPNAKVAITGDKYENINWFDAEPAITKAEYEAGFTEYPAWKAEQDAAKAAAKAAAQSKLEALGLTVQDLQALGL